MANDTAVEFEDRFPTEAACRDHLMQRRWPDGFGCPHCGGQESWRLKAGQWECRACHRQTSATAGTIFAGSRKPLELWFRAMWSMTRRKQGASAAAQQGLLQIPPRPPGRARGGLGAGSSAVGIANVTCNRILCIAPSRAHLSQVDRCGSARNRSACSREASKPHARPVFIGSRSRGCAAEAIFLEGLLALPS